MAASWRSPSCWAVDAEPGTLVALAKVVCGSVKKGQVGGAVAGSRRLWWGGAVLAAFVLRFVLLFDVVVDVPVVQIVDVGVQLLDKVVLPVVVQDRGFGPDSAARGFRSCSSWIRW